MGAWSQEGDFNQLSPSEEKSILPLDAGKWCEKPPSESSPSMWPALQGSGH